MKNDINPTFQARSYALLPEQQLIRSRLDAASCDVQKTLELSGAWDALRLQEALRSSLSRHDALALRVGNVAGYSVLRQYFSTAPLSAIELLEQPCDQRASTPQQIAVEQRQRRLAQDAGMLVSIRQQDRQAWLVVLTASRLVLDELSLDIIWQQALQAYQNNAAAAAADDAFHYEQYLDWRQELLGDPDAAESRQYWQQVQQRHQEIADAGLPFRCEHAGKQRSAVTAVIAPAVAQQLSLLATQRQIDLEVLLQSAWWLLLARIGGVDVIRGDWRHDCRFDYEVMAQTAGVFEKLLPVQLACPPQAVLWSVTAALQEQLETHRLRQEYWEYDLVSSDADASSRMAFSCARKTGTGTAADVLTDVLTYAASTTPPAIAGIFELLLQIDLDVQGLPALAALHAAAVYDAASAACLLDQYLGVLAEMAAQGANDALRVQDLNMYGQLDLRYVTGWHGEAMPPAQETFTALLASWAARTPQALALMAPDMSLNYAQLESQVARAAAALRRQGVLPGAIVGLMVPRSGALVVALLAVMRAGASYLPLDPDWPAARTQAILADARPSLLVVHAVAGNAPLQQTDVLPPHVDLQTLLAQEAGDGVAEVTAAGAVDDVAYVIYTSGSTGSPKGVAIEHRQLLNYAAAVTRAFGLDQCRRFALTSTIAADLGYTTLFGALFNGAELVVAGSADMADGAHFADFMRKHQIEVLKIVPSHFSALIAAGQPYFPQKLILGGEVADSLLLQKVREQAPDCRVFNHYGPTETTVGVLVHSYADAATTAAVAADAAILSTPLANCSVHLLDAHGKAVPTGAIGELYLGGAQLGRGYIGARTGTPTFVDNAVQPGERLYRSGDLARRLPDGSLVLAGRSDDQVKIRGFRIEPAEVEHACKRLDGVADAAVRIWKEDAQVYIAAYLAFSTDGGPRDSAALRQQLQTLLPAAFMPAYLETVPAIPRLGNGKVDRQRLADPRRRQLDGASSQALAAAPASALESVLLRIGAELLKKDDFDVTQNFFDVGGDSLLAIRFVAKARELLKIDLLPGDVFAASSMRGLAAHLVKISANAQALEKLAGLRWKLMNMSQEQIALLETQARAGSEPSARQ